MRESDGWLYIRIVRIIKSEIVNMNPNFKIWNAQGYFWKFYRAREKAIGWESNSPCLKDPKLLPLGLIHYWFCYTFYSCIGHSSHHLYLFLIFFWNIYIYFYDIIIIVNLNKFNLIYWHVYSCTQTYKTYLISNPGNAGSLN